MTNANTNYPIISDSDLTALSKLGPVEDCVVRVYRRMCQSPKSRGYYTVVKAMVSAMKSGFIPLIIWIIRARRIGKTDFFLHVAIELWIVYHKKTMWIRSMDVELSDPAFARDFLNDAIEYDWCPETWTSDKNGVKDTDGEWIISWSQIRENVLRFQLRIIGKSLLRRIGDLSRTSDKSLSGQNDGP